MADLITTDDIEAALDRTAVDTAELEEWQRYISMVSDYIKAVTDYSYEPVTETARLKADSYGQIELKQPVVDITSVLNWRTQMDDFWVDWDGISKLYYLEPHQVVDVTYTYGYAVVPDDIAEVALNLVLGLIAESVPTNITKYKVGDVEEIYSDSRVARLVDEYVNEVLDRYRREWYSIPLATDSFPEYSPRGFATDFS